MPAADEQFLAELMIVSFNFAPRGWALCNGQFLPINQNQALFSLLGTQFGGNGQTTFALPDLRGRVAINEGTSSEGTPYVVGEAGGGETVTLAAAEIPSHTHAATVTTPLAAAAPQCFSGGANKRSPVGAGLAMEASGVTALYSATHDSDLRADAVRFDGTGAISNAGGSQPHANLQPYLALQFCISLQGVFPGRA
jgi:microcystin-dependent protein